MSDTSFKNGVKRDALPPSLFNFALYYAIRRVDVNQQGFKLNGTNQHLVYAGDVNIVGGRVHTIQKNKALVVTSRETGPEVNAE